MKVRPAVRAALRSPEARRWPLSVAALTLLVAASASPALARHSGSSSHHSGSFHSSHASSFAVHSASPAMSHGHSSPGVFRSASVPTGGASDTSGPAPRGSGGDSGGYSGGGGSSHSGGGGGGNSGSGGGGGNSGGGGGSYNSGGGGNSGGHHGSGNGGNGGGNGSGNWNGHHEGNHGSGGGAHYGGGRRSGGHFRGGYYYPSFWGSFYFGYPYPYWYYGPWGYYDYDYYYHDGYYRDRNTEQGALDLDLNPADTQVYVDGQYVGKVDDFDGWPQYLWLDPGTYDIVFYREGYKTLSRQVTVYRGLVVDWDDRLEQGPSIRPEDLAPKTHERRDARIEQDREMRERAERGEQPWRDRARGERYRRHDREDDRDDRDRDDDAATAPRSGDARSGRLHLAVEPHDASVYLDGRFLGTGDDVARMSSGLLVDPGPHTLSVVRPGRRADEQRFDVKAGQQIDLKIALRDE